MNKSTQRRVLSERDFNQIVFVAVPAFGYELRFFIQGRIWVDPQDGQFFCQAQLAVHCAAAVRYSFVNDGPIYDRNVNLILILVLVLMYSDITQLLTLSIEHFLKPLIFFKIKILVNKFKK